MLADHCVSHADSGVPDSGTIALLLGVALSGLSLRLLAWREGSLARSREWLDRAVKAAVTAGDAETLHYVTEVKTEVES